MREIASWETWQTIADFEDGRVPWAEAREQPVEAGEETTISFPTEHAGERNPATPWL